MKCYKKNCFLLHSLQLSLQQANEEDISFPCVSFLRYPQYHTKRVIKYMVSEHTEKLVLYNPHYTPKIFDIRTLIFRASIFVSMYKVT